MNENKKNEVILIGLPNSGKSTLINTLTNKKNSIIGSEPNTTCLLYTSPSPRDSMTSRMPSSA